MGDIFISIAPSPTEPATGSFFRTHGNSNAERPVLHLGDNTGNPNGSPQKGDC